MPFTDEYLLAALRRVALLIDPVPCAGIPALRTDPSTSEKSQTPPPPTDNLRREL
ncbi:hypothetical protein KZZ52_09655 [Dactylosporangium sp. AC04546]|uniref:hypothetical protein n=1 Tax=Dactylosporangium sp. AC04546 TaxID=2862460 RepID=UPI001EDDD444|nr:hypothetical protein [Dactylosporangium sp. AC04546]WVK85629.1 hypothetical protein KZZ52_09655 [Dactylosporangium sp. AC04546]